MMHPLVYITKPLLSQAWALIYPKVFVSLGIQKYIKFVQQAKQNSAKIVLPIKQTSFF